MNLSNCTNESTPNLSNDEKWTLAQYRTLSPAKRDAFLQWLRCLLVRDEQGERQALDKLGIDPNALK